MNNIQKDLKLLPYRYKKYIYGFIFFLIIAVIIVVKVFHGDKALFSTIFEDALLLSLLLLTLTGEKTEDELLMKIRLKALAGAFIDGVATVIVEPLINLLFDGSYIFEKGAGYVLINMFMFYFIFFYLMKRNR